MEEKKNYEVSNVIEEEEQSSFTFASIYAAFILNWKWFLLSLIICLGLAAIYLRYTTPIYQTTAKLLVKGSDKGYSSNASLRSSLTTGIINQNEGLSNEIQILRSRRLAEEAVKDLKLYVNYVKHGRVNDVMMYKDNYLNVDIDPASLNNLPSTVVLEVTREKNAFKVEGTAGRTKINQTLKTLPASIKTSVGTLSFTANPNASLKDGNSMTVTITSPRNASGKYAGSLGTSTMEGTSIAILSLKDESPSRASDYIKQLVVCYNRQANDDKNEVANRTEEFINSRLEKINAELNSTEGELEAYKKRNNMVNLNMSGSSAFNNSTEFEQKLASANTQVQLLNELSSYVREPVNKYQVIPSNIGLADGASTQLISRYNQVAMERNRLLKTASETSPAVTPLTEELDGLSTSIQQALNQQRRSLEIQRNSIASQFSRYTGQIQQTPEQERMLTQIGRQQEVKSGLYLMLLQKREENSISLAATADKGKLIDDPSFAGMISPKSNMIFLIALAIAIGLPSLILFLISVFRYKIEGHDDVAKLTKLPIIADVAVASETAKTKADIVVHENQNNQMEEIFRSMRTNLQFMMKENDKVVMFTSSTSGEGKTFNAANLAVSFALLGKKVVLVGLDIRKPRLAELFELKDHHHGITPLLTHDEPTWDMVKEQILPSGVNDNLELLLAGPIPPNPAELLTRDSLDKVMNLLRDKYDYIIIDTAPVGLVTDTLQIGRVSDATVYMCRADYTPKASFDLINGLANEGKLPNMSIVINGIDMSKKKYGYYYGYGKYGKYGRYGRYGSYGKYGRYGTYGSYGRYGTYGYGQYGKNHYASQNDTSIKLKK